MNPGLILSRLHDSLESAVTCRRIADLRIGLSYVCVQLDSGAAGLAAVVSDRAPCGCNALKEGGSYAGASAADALRYLVNAHPPLHCAIGLATANALIAPPQEAIEDREATSYFHLQPGEKVAMVGLFSPLVERIRATGAKLTVIEKNPERIDVLSDEDKQKALQECDVAIITATTLLNNTFEETVNLLGRPRITALLGPSTPLLSDIFCDTPVTHLGGAMVADAGRVLQIVSEGGGTPALRSYLRFVNLMVK